jgi:transposase
LHQRRAEGSEPFLWAVGVPGAKMQRMMSLQYGKSVMSQRIVSEWIERFKNSRTSDKHGEGTGRQSTSINNAAMERVYGMILQNRQVTANEVAHQLKISRGSAYESIHISHVFHKVFA